jgi:hypothetical protein
MSQKVQEIFNNGTEAYYKVTIDFSETVERWKRECTHPNATREENLVGEGAMEYVQWYDCYCPACGKKWTEN